MSWHRGTWRHEPGCSMPPARPVPVAELLHGQVVVVDQCPVCGWSFGAVVVAGDGLSGGEPS